MTTDSIAFVGFGEAAMAFRGGWGDQAPAGIRAFDIKTLTPATAPAMKDRYAAKGVVGAESIGAALDGATIAFSLVTADQALVAARQAAEQLLEFICPPYSTEA